MRARLIGLYAELARHTEGECSGACAQPRSCCEEQYCLMAIEFARTQWQVELEPTWHPVLPLMGDDGCTALAHLRPICTAHTCEICAHGEKRGDARWTARYREIMQAIGEIEAAAAIGA